MPSSDEDVKSVRGGAYASTEALKYPAYESNDLELSEKEDASYETVALKALHVDDDPTLNPWTFRMFFLGKLTTVLLTVASKF